MKKAYRCFWTFEGKSRFVSGATVCLYSGFGGRIFIKSLYVRRYFLYAPYLVGATFFCWICTKWAHSYGIIPQVKAIPNQSYPGGPRFRMLS
jgi:hypothetical protein